MSSPANPGPVGRFAAVVWGMAGLLVLTGGLAEVPTRVREIREGYGVRDAQTLLVGAGIAILAGVGALASAVLWWRRSAPLWLVAPAMILASGAVIFAWMLGRARDVLGAVPLLASPYGLLLLGPASIVGLVLMALVWLVDTALESRT